MFRKKCYFFLGVFFLSKSLEPKEEIALNIPLLYEEKNITLIKKNLNQLKKGMYLLNDNHLFYISKKIKRLENHTEIIIKKGKESYLFSVICIKNDFPPNPNKKEIYLLYYENTLQLVITAKYIGKLEKIT